MLLSAAVCDYVRYLSTERGLARRSIFTYQSWLRDLVGWMAENGYDPPHVADLTMPVLRRLLYYKAEKQHHRPRTIRGAFNAIRGMCDFFVIMGLLPSNPGREVTLPKRDAEVRLTISNEEIKALFVAVERQRDKRRVALSRAMLHVLVYGALRREELLCLKVGDIHIENDVVRVTIQKGKGNKRRRIWLPDSSTPAIKEWLALRGECSHDWLWSHDSFRRVYNESLRHMLDDIKAIAGFAGRKNILPHSMRHWRATDLLKSDVDLKTIQMFLGHATIATTDKYLHSNEVDVEAAANHSKLLEPPLPLQSAPTPPVSTRGAGRGRFRHSLR